MINTNYAKLVGGYPEYLRLPVELKSPLIINGVTHPAGAHLSTNDDAAIAQGLAAQNNAYDLAKDLYSMGQNAKPVLVTWPVPVVAAFTLQYLMLLFGMVQNGQQILPKKKKLFLIINFKRI